ncbi:hypothetical protein L9F63_005907, partial [Diploptera punctata]
CMRLSFMFNLLIIPISNFGSFIFSNFLLTYVMSIRRTASSSLFHKFSFLFYVHFFPS